MMPAPGATTSLHLVEVVTVAVVARGLLRKLVTVVRAIQRAGEGWRHRDRLSAAEGEAMHSVELSCPSRCTHEPASTAAFTMAFEAPLPLLCRCLRRTRGARDMLTT